MKSKLSYPRAPGPCGSSRPSPLAGVLIAAATLCAASHARVALTATPPPWVQAQASAALPEHDDETDAALLYADVSLTVQPNGKILRQAREVYRILRPAGVNRGIVRADFDAQSRVTHMHGWSIPVDGKPYDVSERD